MPGPMLHFGAQRWQADKNPAASYPFTADAAVIASETILIARFIGTPSFHNFAAAEYKDLYPCAVRYRL